MPVVGTLTVDLVANTATFQGDLGKAANSAKEFGKSGVQAGTDFNFSMREARGSLMLMEHEMGVRLPREMNTLIASIPGIGLAFEALLPIMGAVFAAKMIYDFVEKNKKASDDAAKSWDALGSGIETSLHKADAALLTSQIAVDELDGRHLKALQERLQQIDNQTLDKLDAEFKKVGLNADKMFDDLTKKSAFFGTFNADEGVEKIKTLFDAVEARVDMLGKQGDSKGITSELTQGIGELNAKLKTQQQLYEETKSTSYHQAELNSIVGAREALQGQLDTQNRLNAAAANEKHVLTEKYSTASEDASFEAANRHQLEMHAWKLKGLADQADIAAAMTKQGQAAADLYTTLSGGEQKSANAFIASKQKEADEWVKLTKKMIDEDSKHAQVMADLQAKEAPSSKKGENARYQAQLAAFAKERSLLTSSGEQRVADERKISNKEEEEAQKHTNKMAEIQRQYFTQLNSEAARSVAGMITGQESIGQAAKQMFLSMTTSMIQHFVEKKLMQMEDMVFTSASNRAEQTTAATLAGANMVASWAAAPFPIDALAPSMGATAFASAMSFHGGGEIPGYGDVPIMAQGGETVVTRQLTEQVKNNRGGGGGGGHTFHSHYNISAIDANGVAGMLKKHSDVFAKHVTSQIRRLNK
jgi:hypothetical protein